MPTYFLDTSALVKRHVLEKGHIWIDDLCRSGAGNIIVISEVALVEVVATFSRMVRENPPRLQLSERDQLISVFESFVSTQYIVVEVNRAVFIRAAMLTRSHPLRAYDAIQLASALTYQADMNEAPIFVCADLGLLGAAVAVGLAIENPNNHP